ncbi:hypothetical protein F2Q69_00015021 [Brassica cretica]|uniref:Uncharacterized protein n=1 Tax=Brassica cretica TaxID=69181 RepID=A0A8S9R6E8_BRACR|nr:hypothetical protein F2Q69_00015021 [Brassica cretica]
MSSLLAAVNTDVFWNKEDCRIPEGLDPHNIYQNIKSALAKPGCRGEVSIWAYCEKNDFPWRSNCEIQGNGKGHSFCKLRKMSLTDRET